MNYGAELSDADDGEAVIEANRVASVFNEAWRLSSWLQSLVLKGRCAD